MSIVDKFRKWLENRAPHETVGEYGHASAVARVTGLSPSYVTRIFSGEHKGDASLSVLEGVASAVGKSTVWELLKEVEESSAATTVVPIDVQITRAWRELFAGNPRRGKRVLENLQRQEVLGYTETISLIVHLIIENGPKAAALGVSDALSALQKNETEAIRRKRLKIARELEK